MALPILPLIALGGLVAFALSKGSPSGTNAGPGQASPNGTASVPSIYDAGMPLTTQQAVTQALQTETDPSKLQAFAASLLPDFPKASGLLSAKAASILAAQSQGVPSIPIAPNPNQQAVLNLPTAQNPMALPFFPSPGSEAIVTTQTDPLNVRDQPSTSGNILGQLPQGSAVNIIGGPDIGDGSQPLPGWAQVQKGPLQGWASLQFLADANAPESAQAALGGLENTLQNIANGGAIPASFSPSSSQWPAGATVNTQTTPLNIRSQPSTTGSVVGQANKGDQVTITSAPVSGDNSQAGGWAPVLTQDGVTGFASMAYLSNITPMSSMGVTAGAMPEPGSSVVPDADLLEWANRLDSALQTGTCRSSQEPLVQRFQTAAYQRGIYRGAMSGYYDEPTRGALQVVLGKAPPPCVRRTGGPVNAEQYWNPQGA